MAFDLEHVVEAAAKAAIEDSPESTSAGPRRPKRARRGLPAGRAFLIGAGLVTVGRLMLAARGRNLLENLEQRLVEYEERLGGDGAGPLTDEDYEDEPE
jgi:hypothetical protein